MNKEKLITKLLKMNEFMLAGYLSGKNKYDRAVMGLIFMSEYNKLPSYDDSYLYPINSTGFFTGGKILTYSYSYPFIYNERLLLESSLLEDEKLFIKTICSKVYQGGETIADDHCLAGRGYTHFVPNYNWFIHHSIDEYIEIIKSKEKTQFISASFKLILYIKKLILKISDFLFSINTDKSKKIALEYRKFISQKADSCFGALIRINFIFHLDSCDNLGRLDYYLKDFIVEKETLPILKELFKNMEKQNAWNVTLSMNNIYTKKCLIATDGLSKPNLSLRINSNTNDDNFNSMIECIKKGFAPSFYNDEAYITGLMKYKISYEDASSYCFGGCSELQIDGKSNTGSIDAGINLIKVINKCFNNFNKELSKSDFIYRIKKSLVDEIRLIVKEVNQNSILRGKTNPQMIRSLLCEGCIDKGIEFNSGGAIYNFSTINIVGLANAADILYIVDELVYKRKIYSLLDLKAMIKQNHFNHEYLSKINNMLFFGNDNDHCDKYAKLVFNCIVKELSMHKLKRGNGIFLPSCILFNAASEIGKRTSCSLDGRKAGDWVADSGGSMTGKDNTSPTALLNSISKIKPYKALGTWIVNITLSCNILNSQNGYNCFKSLIKCYFNNGGNQIQPTIINKELLIKAMTDDKIASKIIVRVGGFSERFSNLSDELKRNILSRTIY